MGISEIVFAVLVFTLLVVQGIMLWCATWYIRGRDGDKELKELTRKVAELAEDSVALQKETNRLLKKIVFEEADTKDQSKT